MDLWGLTPCMGEIKACGAPQALVFCVGKLSVLAERQIFCPRTTVHGLEILLNLIPTLLLCVLYHHQRPVAVSRQNIIRTSLGLGIPYKPIRNRWGELQMQLSPTVFYILKLQILIFYILDQISLSTFRPSPGMVCLPVTTSRRGSKML